MRIETPKMKAARDAVDSLKMKRDEAKASGKTLILDVKAGEVFEYQTRRGETRKAVRLDPFSVADLCDGKFHPHAVDIGNWGLIEFENGEWEAVKVISQSAVV